MLELKELSLSHNCLTGPLLARWSPKLESLLLDNNNFTGTLPAQLTGASKTLVTFSAAGNALTGRLPPQYGELPKHVLLSGP